MDRIKRDDRDYSVVCFQCGNEFEARRSDASFCSARCRVAFSREPQKMRNAIDHMNGLARMIDGYARKYSRSTLVFEAMSALHKSIGASLSRFETD